MNVKLAIAFCCLLVAVQARPKAETSQCSLSCASRSFWTGFQTGTTYQYKFEHKVELSSDLSSKQSSRMHLGGIAKVQVHSDCEMVLTVELSNSSVSDVSSPDTLNPRETPKKVLEALRQPLRFSYENGQVVNLCPNDKETRASLNLKRGILSQLQVSTEQRGEAKQLEERDILGDCWTEYSPEGLNTLLKTKDLSTCKLGHQAYPLRGVKSFDEKNSNGRSVMKGSLKCRIELDETKDIIKQIVCLEEQIQSTDNTEDASKDFVRVKTKLTLQSEVNELASVLTEVSERTDLKHGHKTSEECQTRSNWLEEDYFQRGNECVEKKMPNEGKESKDFTEMVKKTLKELCEDTKDESVKRYTSKKYSDLIKYMRGITEQKDFEEVYQLVQSGFCKENPMVKTMMQSAIPTVGTKESVRLILKQIRSNKVSPSDESSWLVNGIALLQHPTTELLPDLLEFVKKRRDEQILGVNRNEYFALAALVHRVCQEQDNCESDPKVKAVVDFFSGSIGASCDQFSSDADNAFPALLAIGNLGRVSGGATTLINCAKNQKIQMVYRVFALHSLRRFSQWSSDDTEQLLIVLRDDKADSELRITAYQMLARFAMAPESQLLRSIESILDSEKEDEQVQFYIYTHLNNLEKSKKKLVARLLENSSIAAKMNKLSRRQHSNNMAGSYFSDYLGQGAKVDANVIFSSKNMLPRYVNFNLTVNDPSKGQSVNLLEIGLRMEGLESILESFYDQIASKFGAQKKELTRKKRSVSFELSDEQRKMQKSKTQPRLDFLIRKYGVEMSHINVDGKVLQALPDFVENTDMQSLKNMFSKQFLGSSSGMESMGNSAGTLEEETLSIPTFAGLPILIKREVHYVTNMRLKKALDTVSYKKLDAEFEFKPVATVHTSKVIAVDAIFERAGIEWSTNVLTSSGVKITVKINFEKPADRRFTFKIEPLEKKQSIVDARSTVNFFQHSAKKSPVNKSLKTEGESTTYEKCTDKMVQKYTGHRLCAMARYTPSDNAIRTFQRNPGYFQLFMEKTGDFGAFEVTFNKVNKPENKQLLIVLGDRLSSDRQLMLNLLCEKEEKDFKYQVEFVNPIFPVRYNWTVTKKSDDEFKVEADAQMGSVFYIASGSAKFTGKYDVKIDGELYRKENKQPKLQFTLTNKYDGLLFVLPKAETELKVVMQKNKQLTMKYSLAGKLSEFQWAFSTVFKAPKKGDKTIEYRLDFKKDNADKTSKENRMRLLYDLEMRDGKDSVLAHSLHMKTKIGLQGKEKDLSGSIIHSLQYGRKGGKRSPIDFEIIGDLKSKKKSDELIEFNGSAAYTVYRQNGTPMKGSLDNVKLAMGTSPKEIMGLEKLRFYSLSYDFSGEGKTKIGYSADLSYLPLKRWTLGLQAFQVEAKVQTSTGKKSDYISGSYRFQLRHLLNANGKQLSQIAKYENNDRKFTFVHEFKRSHDEMMHSLTVQDAEKNGLRTVTKVSYPKERTTTVDTTLDIHNERFLGAKQTFEYQDQKDIRIVKHKVEVQIKSRTYSFESETKLAKETVANFIRFIEYQHRLISGRYNIRISYELFQNFMATLKLDGSFTITSQNPKMTITFAKIIDLKNPNGIVWKTLIEKTNDKKKVLNYGIVLKRTSNGTGLEKNVPWLRGFEMEFNSMENSIKSKSEVKVVRKEDKQYDVELKINSMDSWDCHKIEVDSSASFTKKQGELSVKGALATKGKIRDQSMDSTGEFDLSYGYEKEAKKYILNASLATSSSKLQLNYKVLVAPQQSELSLQLNSDFQYLTVKDLQFNLTHAQNEETLFKLTMSTKLEKEEKASVKIEGKRNKLQVEVETAHEMFKEAGFQLTWSPKEENGFRKVTTEFKMNAFGQDILLKETGSMRLVLNEGKYLFDFAIKSTMELKGFEEVVKHSKLQYEMLLGLKRNMDFNLLGELEAPENKTQLMRVSSVLTYWPFKAEAKLLTNFGAQYRNGFRVEFEKTKASIGLEVIDRDAMASYEIEDPSENKRKFNIRVSNNFFVAKKDDRMAISGDGTISWPLELNNFEATVQLQLPVQRFEKTNLELVNRDLDKRILLTIESEGKTQKVVEGKFSQNGGEEGIRGEGRVHIDVSDFVKDSQGIVVQVNYLLGENKELNIVAKPVDSETKIFNVKLFWYAQPRQVEGITHGNVNSGFLLQTKDMLAFVTGTDKSETESEWKLKANKNTWKKDVTADVVTESGSVKSGEANIFGQEYSLSNLSQGVLEFSMKSGSSSKSPFRIQWTKKYESLESMDLKVEIHADGQSSLVHLTRKEQEIEIRYGRSDSPNTLKVTYQVGDKNSLTFTHQTRGNKAAEMTILPGVNVELPMTQHTFKVETTLESDLKTVSFLLESRSLNIESFTYTHDLTNFPKAMQLESKLVNPESAEDLWKTTVSIDIEGSKIDVQSQILNVFKLIFKETKFELRVDNVADITIDLPNIMKPLDTDKMELKAEITLPVLKITEPISWTLSTDNQGDTRQIVVQYLQGSASDIKGTLKVKKLELTSEFNIDIEGAVESKNILFSSEVRSAGLKLETQRKSSSSPASVTASVVIDVNGNEWSATSLSLSGKLGSWPAVGELKMNGAVESTITYNFERDDGSNDIVWTFEKIGDTRRKYDLLMKTMSPKDSSVMRDFKFNLETPNRHYVISKEARDSGEIVSEFFVNKRSNNGLTVTYKKDESAEKPTARIQIELPTRTLLFTVETDNTDKKYGIQTSFAWDAQKTPSKSIELSLTADCSKDSAIIVECKAPFLKEKAKVEFRHQKIREGYTGKIEYSSGDSDSLVAKFEYRFEDQVEMGKVTYVIETKGASESMESKLTLTIKTKEASGSDGKSYEGTLSVKVPSQSIDRTFDFVYSPMRELTLACNKGSSLSIQYSTSQWVKTMTVFVSDNEKKAARLLITFDQKKTLLTGVLHTGKGKFDLSSDSKNPIFRPEEQLVSTSAGISAKGKEVHVALYAGKMTIGQKLSVANGEEVPADLSFFTAGLRLQEGNKLKYFSNWRSADSDKLTSAIDYLKETLLNTWTTSNMDSVSAVISSASQELVEKIKENMDVQQIVDEVMNFAATDLDQLSRYLEKAVAENEFYFRSIKDASSQILKSLRVFNRRMTKVLGELKDTISTWTANFEIPEFMKTMLDSISDYFRSITFTEIWSESVVQIKQLVQNFQEVCKEFAQSLGQKLTFFYEKVLHPFNADSFVGSMNAKIQNWDVTYRLTRMRDAIVQFTQSGIDFTSGLFQQVMQQIGYPFAMHHLSDLRNVYELYNDALLEIRIWYDTDATPKEREAYSETMRMVGYFTSEQSKGYWRNVIKSYNLLIDGQYSEAFEQFMQTSTNAVEEWRPECDEKCTAGETFATVKGTVYVPIYMGSLNPASWKAKFDSMQAPKIVLRRIKNKLFATSSDGYVLMSILNDWRQMGGSFWDPIARLLSIKHRTAVIQGANHMITFDGVSLMHKRPCNYLLAHDFENGDFSIVQTYKKARRTNEPVRDQLMVRFGNVRVSISREGIFKVNDKIEKLPIKKVVSGKTVEAERDNQIVEARFHSEMKDVLVIRCSSVTDSCVIKVHPLYHGKVAGLAGSNDGRKSNDIHQDSNKHVEFWTAGECAESGDSTTKDAPPSEDAQCHRWFKNGVSSFDKCFSSVSPKPFFTMCTHYQAAGKDICNVATLYIERCRNELVNINTPRTCIKCKVNGDKEIKSQDLITDKDDLQKTVQVVFLVENSRCALDAIGKGSSKSESLKYLATLLNRLAPSDSERSVQFGLAVFGDQVDDGESGMHAYRINDDSKTFGSLQNLLAKVRSGMDKAAGEVNELDVLKAIAQLNEKYDWEPLAQKHVVIVSCKKCSTRSWNYATLFDKAFNVVKDQIHMHVITKDSIPKPTRSNDWTRGMVGYNRQLAYFSDRRSERIASLSTLNPNADCARELALDKQSLAEGSVWSFEEFTDHEAKESRNAKRPTPSVKMSRQLFENEIRQRYEHPQCRRCDCALSERMVARPRCRVAACP